MNDQTRRADGTVVVDGKAVGIIGLDGVLNDARSRIAEGISVEDAAFFALNRIEERNYIPPAKKDAYLKAITVLLGGASDQQPGVSHLIVRILGPGCVSCNRLEELVMRVLQQRNIMADIFHVRELDEIWRYGVISTPALVVNEKVKSTGRLPSQAEVEKWILEETTS
ncbi:MAG: thioredoxin family protein [Deltaproteobacteria bacterium]|jgi:small redox-active disulfide protein 2|nr:thioredoxin family protein [Deltaproteobacteria bacterium]